MQFVEYDSNMGEQIISDFNKIWQKPVDNQQYNLYLFQNLYTILWQSYVP